MNDHEFEHDHWEFISYERWGNDEDGYEVNQAFYTGIILDLVDSDSDTAVIKAMRDAGLVGDGTVDDNIDVDGDEHTIYINYNGWPACELRRTDRPATSGGLQ